MTTCYISTSGKADNDGLSPETPIDYFPTASHTSVLFNRRDVFKGLSIKPRSKALYGAYGEGDKPLIFQDGGTIFRFDKERDVKIKDLAFSGFERAIYGFNLFGLLVQDCAFIDSASSADQCVYVKYGGDIAMTGCTNKNTYGDVFYGTQISDVLINKNNLTLPDGGGADAIQFTDEYKSSRTCKNVVIEHNNIEAGDSPQNYKGAIAVEGTENYTISNNKVVGRVFGIQASGKDGVVTENTVYRLLHDHRHQFGIGVGANNDAENITITRNLISHCRRGVVVSAGSGDHLRKNIIINDNELFACEKDYVVDVPMTGRINDIRML